MREKRYILFDLDGTLTDPKEGITKSVQHALAHFGIAVDDLDSLIPFIGRFGDEAFAMLSDDPRWAERYFLPDGTPNPEATTVIDMLPIIGAPYTLGRNLLMGYPSSWGEVGWAALDIADGFLLIASFGSSTPLSAAKGVAKSSLKAVEKNITRIPLHQAGRDILSAAAKRSWRLAAKNSPRARRATSSTRWGCAPRTTSTAPWTAPSRAESSSA